MYYNKYSVFLWLVILLSLISYKANAQEPGEDHPLLTRFSGAEMLAHQSVDYGAVTFPHGPVGDDRIPDPLLNLEGKITWISYELPEDKSTLEVLRNYETALSEGGLNTTFSCTGDECGRPSRFYRYMFRSGDVFRSRSRRWSNGRHNTRARYLVAKRSDSGGSAHILLYILEGTYIKQIVVESEQMETGQVETGVRSADELQTALTTGGKAIVPGIYFNTDSDAILPESAEALEQMALLLENESDLKVFIVGHTDNRGDFDYNLDLSIERAESVLQELVSEYDISGDRLEAKGVASLAPVETNQTEEGREQNRRVEMVVQ